MLHRISHYKRKKHKELGSTLPLPLMQEAPPLVLAAQTVLMLGCFILMALAVVAARYLLP